MLGSPLARAAEAPGRGTNWGMAAPSPTLPRGTRIKVGTVGPLERILLGPAHVTDGSENLDRRAAPVDGRARRPDDPRDAAGRDGLRAVGRDRGQVLAASPLIEATRRDPMEDELVLAGRVARIESVGHQSGLDRSVTVGFVEEDDGSLLVAANDPDTAWAANLLADPVCSSRSVPRFRAVAEPLDADDHARVVRELILRYGTPSERLGRGPSFRLRPDASDAA